MSEISSPDFLTLLSAHNNQHGIRLTFSEMKKTARRIGKAYDARPDQTVAAEDYFLDYSDITGETAVAHVMNPTDCDHHASVTRRLQLAAV